MKNVLSVALLGAAVLGSIATSEPTEPPAPVGPTSSARVSGDLALAPGQSATRRFRVGVALNEMSAITDSWIDASATVQTSGGSATVELEVVGFDQSDLIELFANTQPYTDVATVNGIDTGCLSGGDGLCWTTWTVTYRHAAGSGDVLVDYGFEALIPLDGLTIAVQPL